MSQRNEDSVAFPIIFASKWNGKKQCLLHTFLFAHFYRCELHNVNFILKFVKRKCIVEKDKTTPITHPTKRKIECSHGQSVKNYCDYLSIVIRCVNCTSAKEAADYSVHHHPPSTITRIVAIERNNFVLLRKPSLCFLTCLWPDGRVARFTLFLIIFPIHTHVYLLISNYYYASN